MPQKTLVVITGPTGVGKTAVAIRLARDLGTEIVSADSRQIFRDIPIGTAAPTADELAAVRHHFVGILGLDEYYSAAQFEEDALAVIGRLFLTHDYVVMCGGSMMYVDAVCKGIDQLPTISDDVRRDVARRLAEDGGGGACRGGSPRLSAAPPQFAQHRRLQGDVCLFRRHDGLSDSRGSVAEKHARLRQEAANVVCQGRRHALVCPDRLRRCPQSCFQSGALNFRASPGKKLQIRISNSGKKLQGMLKIGCWKGVSSQFLMTDFG